MATFSKTQLSFFEALYDPTKSLADIMRELKIESRQLARWCASKIFRRRLNKFLRTLRFANRIELAKAANRHAPKLHSIGRKKFPAAKGRLVYDMARDKRKPRPLKQKRKSAIHLIHPDSLSRAAELMDRIEG